MAGSFHPPTAPKVEVAVLPPTSSGQELLPAGESFSVPPAPGISSLCMFSMSGPNQLAEVPVRRRGTIKVNATMYVSR